MSDPTPIAPGARVRVARPTNPGNLRRGQVGVVVEVRTFEPRPGRDGGTVRHAPLYRVAFPPTGDRRLDGVRMALDGHELEVLGAAAGCTLPPDDAEAPRP